MRLTPVSLASSMPPRRRASGFAMIEVLIAMFLIAMFMLASAGTQINALKFQKSADNRARAVTLAGELGERIEANLVGANNGGYVLAATASPVSMTTDCTAVYCTPTQMARFDLAQWTSRAATSLPLVDVSIAQGVSPVGLVTYTISLNWSERRGAQTYAETGSTETLSYVLVKTVRPAT